MSVDGPNSSPPRPSTSNSRSNSERGSSASTSSPVRIRTDSATTNAKEAPPSSSLKTTMKKGWKKMTGYKSTLKKIENIIDPEQLKKYFKRNEYPEKVQTAVKIHSLQIIDSSNAPDNIKKFLHDDFPKDVQKKAVIKLFDSTNDIEKFSVMKGLLTSDDSTNTAKETANTYFQNILIPNETRKDKLKTLLIDQVPEATRILAFNKLIDDLSPTPQDKTNTLEGLFNTTTMSDDILRIALNKLDDLRGIDPTQTEPKVVIPQELKPLNAKNKERLPDEPETQCPITLEDLTPNNTLYIVGSSGIAHAFSEEGLKKLCAASNINPHTRETFTGSMIRKPPES